MIGSMTSGRRPVPKPNFDDLYKQANGYQAAGDLDSLSTLIQDAHKAGLPSDQLAMLGALVESTFNSFLASAFAEAPAKT